MKFIIILSLLLFVGCGSGFFQADDTGSSPAVRAVKGLRVANAVSSPVNPLALAIDAVLVTVIAGLTRYGRKVKQGSVVTVKKYTAHKRAFAAAMREAKPDVAEALYNSVAEERKKLGLIT